jgi:pimeloyl-ACP methyl ester carboxylesterase
MGITASGARADGLRQVSVPTLVLHGSADRLIDPSGGRRTAELVPGARFVLMEGMGHDYPRACWDEWVDLVATHATEAEAAVS